MMRERSSCDAELSGPAKCRGKTLVLNGAQWSGIVGHLKRGEPEAQQAEQQRQYEEYLKKGSRAITKGWADSAEKIEEQKAAEKLRQQKASQEDGEARYKELMAKDDNKRMEQIAVAQQMMDRQKNGARQLDSAFLLAEVLGTRQQQRRVRAEEVALAKERRMNERMESVAAAEQYAAELRDQAQQKIGYKRQLFEQMQADKGRRQQMAEHVASDEQRYREEEEREMQAQLEMEQMMLLRKKETQRKNALEAMKMAEQRRMSKQSTLILQINLLKLNDLVCFRKHNGRLRRDQAGLPHRQRQSRH